MAAGGGSRPPSPYDDHRRRGAPGAGPLSDWPPSWGLALTRGAGRPEARLLVGGSPPRIVRLGEAGVSALDRLLHAADVDATGAAGRLARRLTDADIAWARPTQIRNPIAATSIVIPVRDRPAGLAATLAALAAPGGGPWREVIVVDDASDDPDATRGAVDAAVDAAAAAVAVAGKEMRLVRRRQRGGPAAARNTGWRAAGGEIVVFVDADCTPDGPTEPGTDWLSQLVAHFEDPCVAAVGPRVRPPVPLARPAGGWPVGSPAGWRTLLARYESARSPLDLGPDPGRVRPNGRVTYLPSATLAVRREVLERIGGFDEAMMVGEDVDLVWRIGRYGSVVRYEPATCVTHPVRPTFAAWLAQRYTYGTSAGSLARRHGGAVAPLRLGPIPAVSLGAGATAAVALRRPALAAAGATAAACAGIGLASRALVARTGLAPRTALALAAQGELAAARAAAEAGRRSWWPVTAAMLLALGTRPRRRLAAMLCVPLLAGWLRAGRPVGLCSWLALHTADDVAYGTGVWVGAWRARTPAALAPRLVRHQPPAPVDDRT